ncbi:hypothetical protein L210DRAFT_3641382 [Boletus edulis BED1]|uniref:G domain-containing protein n=1 Tax=Boletus edulis BED1 TaxID=1328754 RepID=A0AAD4C4C2_BOLED|nr:hypothetical protein L210DRAFT_3641382 [Boletus edulis BED1]
MSSGDPAPQVTPTGSSALNVSTIDIRLARDSRKTIGSISIKLRLNDGSLKDIQKTVSIRAAGVHREEFNPPLVLKPDGDISVSVSCSWPSVGWKRGVNIPIDINLRDVECMRDEQGIKSYRQKVKNVEVLVTSHPLGHQSLLATTASIIELCSRFRLLIIGNSGVGKSSLLQGVFGVEGIHTSEAERGIADIDREFISSTNKRFVVHDSLGFESGDEGNMKIVKDFVARRNAMPELKDQLHAIWLCLETPYAGGRLLDGGVEGFLERRQEILGQIPLVVVLTKVDQLDFELEVNPPVNEDVEQYKSKYLNKHCTWPLHKAAGSDVTHVIVSVQDGYSESLSGLVRATLENMAKYHVHEAPRVVASIAQRVSIREKIELSMAIGKKSTSTPNRSFDFPIAFTDYWEMLLKSAVFGSHTLQEYLQVIRKDVITVWNFDDPDQWLMDDNIIGALLRTDNLGNASEAPLMTSLARLLTSALGMLSGELTSLATPMADIATSVVRIAQGAYHGAENDVKVIMAYVVDLICAMQAIFLLAFGGRVTADKVALALQAYEQPRQIVHLKVDAFDGRLGRDHVLDKVEELIWRYSIADHEIEETRRKISQVLPPGSL